MNKNVKSDFNLSLLGQCEVFVAMASKHGRKNKIWGFNKCVVEWLIEDKWDLANNNAEFIYSVQTELSAKLIQSFLIIDFRNFLKLLNVNFHIE